MIQYRIEAHRILAIDTETDECVGEIDFPLIDEETVVLNHTFVNPNYRGQKIAETLLQHAVERLALLKVKVVVSCSYVVKQFERHPQLRASLSIIE